MELKNKISELLEEEYQKRIKQHNGKYSELKFSKEIGISKDTMHSYLTAARIPNAESLLKIAKGLDCSSDYLLGLSKTKYLEPTEDEKAIIKISELTGLKVETIEKMVYDYANFKKYVKDDVQLKRDEYTGLPILEEDKIFQNVIAKSEEEAEEICEKLHFAYKYLNFIEYLNICGTEIFEYLYDYLVLGNELEKYHSITSILETYTVDIEKGKKDKLISSYPIDSRIVKDSIVKNIESCLKTSAEALNIEKENK